MRRKRYFHVASCIVLVCIAPIAVAQQLHAPHAPPNLVLSMDASRAEYRGIPRSITVKITNVTNHDVLIPSPHLDCADGMYGTLFFRINVRPRTGPAPHLNGCFACYSFGNVSIWDRIKEWKRLTPGQSLVFTRSTSSYMTGDFGGAPIEGRYEFSASYDPPYVSEKDKSLLAGANISVPQQRMVTPVMVFTMAAAK